MIAVLWSVHTRTLATSIITICPHLAGVPPPCSTLGDVSLVTGTMGAILGPGTGDWRRLTNLLRSCQYLALYNKRYFPSSLHLCRFSCPNVCLRFQMSPHSSQVQVPGCGGGVYYWRVSSVNTPPGHSQATARPAATNRDLCERLFTQSSPSLQPPPRGDTGRIKQLDLSPAASRECKYGNWNCRVQWSAEYKYPLQCDLMWFNTSPDHLSSQ